MPDFEEGFFCNIQGNKIMNGWIFIERAEVGEQGLK
jgi:hypothetical protein